VVVDGEDEACAKMSFYLGQGARSLSGMIWSATLLPLNWAW
jgi:hypothetical protein